MLKLRVRKILKSSVVLATLWILFFGFSQFGMGMSMDMNGQINCPFSGHSMSICKMNPMEHIEEWQSMFASLPVKDALSILFTLILFIAVRKLIPWHKFSLLEIKYLYTKYLFRNNFHIHYPLKEAFSRGILNPKLF
jgi:hypothetical protein